VSVSLLTEWYLDDSPVRQAELREALRLNCENLYISAVYLFGAPDALAAAPTSPKVVHVAVPARMTFERFFSFATDALAGHLCAIVNADCYFDETLMLVEQVNFTRRVLCLTRWNVQPDGSLRFVNSSGSQDGWIFRSPLRLGANFYLGLLACDKKLAWHLKFEAGQRLANPSLSIRLCHLHASQKRNYTAETRLLPPYVGVSPTLVSPEPAEMLVHCTVIGGLVCLPEDD
jgi:hypothetical protein